jgi:hypothetical protein
MRYGPRSSGKEIRDPDEAIARVEALGLRVLAERIE